MTLLVAVAAVGLLGGPAAAAGSGAGRVRPDLAGAFVGQINAARAGHGRSHLAVDSTLVSVARVWAVSMSKTAVLSHDPRLATFVRGWHFLGENVGVGYSVASLQQAFWASALHRANILDSDFTRVGVGVVDDGGKLWVVEDFSRPAGGSMGPPSPRRTAAAHHAVATHRVNALAAACVALAARRFRARHWLRQDVTGVRLRARLRMWPGLLAEPRPSVGA